MTRTAHNRQENGASFSPEALRRLFAPLSSDEPFAIAVSGGADSTALMHLVARWCALDDRRHESDDARNGGRNRTRVTVLTVDHALRPGSRDEAETVCRAAAALGFRHALLEWTGKKPPAGLQAAARAARYRLMTEYCAAHGIRRLVTAHTQDDQAETFLLRLARGSGVDGLAAMAPITVLGDCVLVRPLLGLSRARLRAFLRSQGIAWTDDPSNENLAFERVRIRRALAELRRVGVTAAAIGQSAARLSRARAALEDAAQTLFRTHAELRPEGYAEIATQTMQALPLELRIRVLAQMLDAVNGGAFQVRLARLEALAGRTGSPRFRATLAGCIVQSNSQIIRVFREPGRMKVSQVDLQPGREVVWDGRFILGLDAAAEASVSLRPLGEDGWRQLGAALLREEDGHANRAAASAPRLAALTTPAAWDGDALLAAPVLGWIRQGCERSAASYIRVRARATQPRTVKQM